MDSQAEFLAKTSQDAQQLISRVKRSSMSDLCDPNFDSIRAAAKVISLGKERECRDAAMSFYAQSDDLFDDLISLTYEEIHDSMSTFGSLFSYFENSMGNVQSLIKDFSEISRLFATIEPATIHQLRMRSMHLSEVLKVLTALQHVLDASSEIDNLMAASKFKEAAECMMRARFVLQQPDFNDFDALDGYRKALAELYDCTFQNMYSILDREIYSWLGAVSAAPSSQSSRHISAVEVACKDSQHVRIRTLIGAIQILGAEKLEALRENLMSDLRNRLQSQIELLLEAALRVSTLSADASSDPLVEFLSSVLCNYILVLKQHAFVLSEMQGIASQRDERSYSIVSVWIVMQSEVQNLVNRYIQLSTAAWDSLPFLSSSSIKVNMHVEHGYAFVDRSERGSIEPALLEPVSFSLPNARLELSSARSSSRDKESSPNQSNEVELVDASPYRILSIFSILKSFLTTCTSILCSNHSSVLQDQELLDVFLDQFVSEDFIPFVLAEYKYRIAEACKSSDIFLSVHAVTSLPPRDTFGAVMEVSAVIDAMVEEATAVAAALPGFMSEVSIIFECIVLRFLDITQEHVDRAVSETKISHILSRSDCLKLLECDPVFMSLPSQKQPQYSEVAAFASLERLRIDSELLQLSILPQTADAFAFLETSGIEVLSNIFSSLQWLASRIRARSALFSRSTSAAAAAAKLDPVRGVAVPKASSPSLANAAKFLRQDGRHGTLDEQYEMVIEDLAARCEHLAKRSLLSLRLLFRCHVFLHLNAISPVMFLRDNATSVPDAFALQLSRQLNIVHDLLQKLIPQNIVFYVFASIPANISGVSSMLKNVHCIKQTLLSLPLFEQSPSLVMNFLKRPTLYYELLELEQDDLLEQIEQGSGMGFTEFECSVLIRLSCHLQSHELALKRLQNVFSTVINPMGIISSMGAGIDRHVDKLTDALSSTFRGVDKVVGVTLDGLTSASEAMRDGIVKTGGAVSKALRRPSVAPASSK